MSIVDLILIGWMLAVGAWVTVATVHDIYAYLIEKRMRDKSGF